MLCAQVDAGFAMTMLVTWGIAHETTNELVYCWWCINMHTCSDPLMINMLHAPPPRSFEGLTRDAVPHGMGVMIFGNGTGGGFHFRDVRRGDK